MAQFQEEVITIKISKLLKDSDTKEQLVSTETLMSLEAVVQELAGSGTLVECFIEELA
jgi:hypothetical protein